MKQQIGYYMRTSHFLQNIGTQQDKIEEGWVVYEDKGISGRIKFEERVNGSKLLQDIQKGKISTVVTNSCDRMGRTTSNILETIQTIHSYGVPIRFLREGITTLDENGNQTPMGLLMVNLLSTLSEFFYLQTREKTLIGIERGKLLGVYKGRKEGSVESIESFRNKPKVKKIVELLGSGLGVRKISRIIECSPNYIIKIKKKLELKN
jgi:DNA invertase Pin-like site-specific DNA recombinase